MRTYEGQKTSKKEHVVSFHLKETNQKMIVIGNIPDTLAKLVHGLMSDWKVLQVIANTDGKHRDAPERTWVLVGGTEITNIYFLYGIKVHESSMRENQTI